MASINHKGWYGSITVDGEKSADKTAVDRMDFQPRTNNMYMCDGAGDVGTKVVLLGTLKGRYYH